MGTVVLKSLGYFLLAGRLEIGGGYLIWRWLREQHPWWMGLLGAALLMIYGVVPTFQPTHFRRVYRAYVGVFILMSPGWGRGVTERTLIGGR